MKYQQSRMGKAIACPSITVGIDVDGHVVPPLPILRWAENLQFKLPRIEDRENELGGEL